MIKTFEDFSTNEDTLQRTEEELHAVEEVLYSKGYEIEKLSHLRITWAEILLTNGLKITINNRQRVDKKYPWLYVVSGRVVVMETYYKEQIIETIKQVLQRDQNRLDFINT